jgi:2,3-bisphosphoglycerate-independent phosphoglycerate mutase
MGAATVVPAGATGQPDSDLAAKAAAAIRAIAGGAARVVVHVGGPDEAAHLRDRAAKVAAIECADRDLLAPLADVARRFGAALRVCPDHGCDPRTGEHDAVPVPCVAWAPRDGALARELERVLAPCAAAPAHRSRRLTERAVAHLPVVELATAAAALGAAA